MGEHVGDCKTSVAGELLAFVSLHSVISTRLVLFAGGECIAVCNVLLLSEIVLHLLAA